MANTDFDPKAQRLYVFDDRLDRMSTIDSDGEIIDYSRIEIDFLDFARSANGDFVFYTGGYHNTRVTGENITYDYFVYDQTYKLKSTFCPIPLTDGNPEFLDYDEFTHVGDSLYFNLEFTDTTYLITDEGPEFSYISRTSPQSRVQSVRLNPDIPDPFPEILGQEIPSVLKSVKIVNRRYERIGIGGNETFRIINENGENIWENRFPVVGGNLLYIPRYYDNNYFFSVMRKRQFKDAQNNWNENKRYMNKYMDYDDTDGLVIVVLEPK